MERLEWISRYRIAKGICICGCRHPYTWTFEKVLAHYSQFEIYNYQPSVIVRGGIVTFNN
jgi:hypothetical protein